MVITSPADRFFPLPRLDGQINRAAGRAELDAPAEGPVKLGLPQGHRPQVALTTPTDRTARPAVVTHHARATATAANDAVDTRQPTRRRATGSRQGTCTCTAPRPCARSPSLACPIHQFAPGGGGGACLERRACIALHASCMALSPRARELPARTAAGGALGAWGRDMHRSSAAGLGQSSARGWPWPRSMHMHGMDAGGSSCFACSSGRAGGLGQSSARLFGSEAFHFSSEESKGVSQTLSVCSDE